MLKQRIQADGIMPGDLEGAIAAALIEEELIVDPFVTVTIAEYHSRPISVMGAVKMPITFQAESPVSLLDALARAGGLSAEAGPEILISRARVSPATAGADAARTDTAELDAGLPPLVQRIPLKALIDAADPEENVKLTGGEEVRVPEAAKIF